MSTQSSNIAFFGTPHLAVWVLEELENAGIIPSVVITAPDKPAGRKLLLTPPPVKIWAEERSIPVLQPASLRDKSTVPELLNTPWDMYIVAAYNIILPQWLLALPRHSPSMYTLHFSQTIAVHHQYEVPFSMMRAIR
jgi:methionyl-tRNA formyltransferase